MSDPKPDTAPSQDPASSAEPPSSHSQSIFASLRAAAHASGSSISTLLDRVRFAVHAGITYEGARDTYKAAGFKRELEYVDYRDRYERGGMPRRLIRALPNEIWSSNIKVTEDDNDSTDPSNETEFDKQYTALVKRRHVGFIKKLRQADIAASIGRYSVMLIGTTDTGEMNEPITADLAGLDSLLYLKIFNEDRARVNGIIGDRTGNAEQIKEDNADPRFGKPRAYSLDFGGAGVPNTEVHWSRVIHVAHDLLDDEVFGSPLLKAIWNYLDSMDKIWIAGAEAVWQTVNKGSIWNVKADDELSEAEMDRLVDDIKAYDHDLEKNILGRNLDVKTMSTPMAQFGPNLNAVLRLATGTIGMPLRIAIGSEQGELASSQDRNNWQDRKDEEVALFAESFMRDVIDRFMDIGLLPRVEEYSVVWPRIEDLTAVETGEVMVNMAQANKFQKEAEGKIITTGEEIRKDVMSKDPLSDDDAVGISTSIEEPDRGPDEALEGDNDNGDSSEPETDNP